MFINPPLRLCLLLPLQLPGLKMYLLKEESKQYCGAEPVLGRTVKQDYTSGDWYKMTVRLSLFK